MMQSNIFFLYKQPIKYYLTAVNIMHKISKNYNNRIRGVTEI